MLNINCQTGQNKRSPRIQCHKCFRSAVQCGRARSTEQLHPARRRDESCATPGARPADHRGVSQDEQGWPQSGHQRQHLRARGRVFSDHAQRRSIRGHDARDDGLAGGQRRSRKPRRAARSYRLGGADVGDRDVLGVCESTLLIEHDHLSYLKTLVIHGFPLPCKSSEITTRFNDGPTSLS